MAAYIRKGFEIPEPSDHSSEDDDITHFKDLDMAEHQPPRSVRLVKKLLDSGFDRAWEVISKHDKNREDAQAVEKVPVLNPTKEMKHPNRINTIVCSDDGVYLFLGHTRGLSVVSTSTLTCVGAWQDERAELSSISCASLANSTHLLCAVDDMGIARLFVHHAENIYLIKVLNETDDINQRHICTKFEVSKSGDFGAAVMTSSGSVWLDVYRFPPDLWLKELETKQATQTPGSTEAKLSPIALVMKIKPPEIPAGTSLKSPFEVLQKTEGGTIIGSGQNHMISDLQWENQDAAFRKMFAKYLKPSQQRPEGPSNCTFHFLLHEGFCQFPGGAKPTRDIPSDLCLWWSGSHNLLHYHLLKSSKEKRDGGSGPDVLWPNAQEILCSAVSTCTRFLVLGLVNLLVTIWDRRFGWPHANIVIPGDSALCKLKLILQSSEQQQVTPFNQGSISPKPQLVVTCKDGACYSVIAGRGKDTHIVSFIERPEDPDTFATVAEPVPFLKSLALLMQRNGQVSVWKMEDTAPVLVLNLPQTYMLGPVWDPVCVLEPVQQKLYVRGDRRTPLGKVTDKKRDESCLFMFSFSQCSLMDQYRITWPAAKEKQTKISLSLTHTDLEEACNSYIQERFNTLEERHRNMAIQWEQLPMRLFNK